MTRGAYTMQGNGRDGRAALQPALHRLVGPAPASAPVPLWLRELRRDTREFLV